MLQVNEVVDITEKINDKIMQVENRNRKKFTQKERDIAFEMFMSGFLFSQQWNGDEFVI